MMPAIIVAGHLAVAVADRPPALNIEQICREETSSALQSSDKVEICIADEKHARDQVTAQWSSYNPAARASCTRTSTSGRVSSYLELLVCLDLDQADREVRGQGSTAGLTIMAPARSASERDGATDQDQGRAAPVAAPSRPAPAPRAQQQQPAARSAAAAPATPAPAPSAPLQVAPSPPEEESPPPTQGQMLQQSFCRSPFGYVLPGCK